MFVEGANGVRPIGDGLLEVSDASLTKLIASGDINEIYDVEHTPFASQIFKAHIVKLHSVHETNVETALVLEMATGGELQTLLDEAGSLSEQQTTICMHEVLKALQFLHKKCIAHLDLKPQNILLCGKRVEDGLKLCDFGISRIVEETGSKVREILGTPDYVAPEVLSYEPLSLKTDICSVGVLAYVLLSGFSPFGGDTKQETFSNISQCNLNFPDDLFQDVSEDAKGFIKSALQVAAEDRMSAVECLEHKWLSESIQPLKTSTKQDSTITVTATATTTTTTLNTIPTDSTPDKHSIESNNDTKSRELDSMNVVATSSPKPNAGFFLHQSPKNGTAVDEVLFSSLNNGFDTTANTNASKLNGMDHQHQQQHHNNHHTHHQNVEHGKQHATTVNNSCSLNPNDTTDLLKDYATNKENINLSKILTNRSSANHQSLINNRTTLHNNNSNNNNNNSSSSGSSTTYDYVDDSSNLSNVLTAVQQTLGMPASNASAVQAKHESILFPDAPTTPKVLRKSNQSETVTPSCAALVKQFQLNNGRLSNRIDFDEINSVSESTTYPQSATSMRNKYTNHTNEHTRDVLPSYRLSATAITTSTTNGHHSLGPSALSINTLTESSVGVSQQHSTSTITLNCLCGADKTANCCCNSSSRTALNYRKKSLAVIDSSILC